MEIKLYEIFFFPISIQLYLYLFIHCRNVSFHWDASCSKINISNQWSRCDGWHHSSPLTITKATFFAPLLIGTPSTADEMMRQALQSALTSLGARLISANWFWFERERARRPQDGVLIVFVFILILGRPPRPPPPHPTTPTPCLSHLPSDNRSSFNLCSWVSPRMIRRPRRPRLNLNVTRCLGNRNLAGLSQVAAALLSANFKDNVYTQEKGFDSVCVCGWVCVCARLRKF